MAEGVSLASRGTEPAGDSVWVRIRRDQLLMISGARPLSREIVTLLREVNAALDRVRSEEVDGGEPDGGR